MHRKKFKLLCEHVAKMIDKVLSDSLYCLLSLSLDTTAARKGVGICQQSLKRDHTNHLFPLLFKLQSLFSDPLTDGPGRVGP